MRQIITDIERLKNTRNGNPRFRVTFQDGHACNTASDHEFAGQMTGAERGEYNVTIGGRGTITSIAPIPATSTCRFCGYVMPATTNEHDRAMNILYTHEGAKCQPSEYDLGG